MSVIRETAPDQRVTSPTDPRCDELADGDAVDEGTDTAPQREAGELAEQGIFPGVPFS